MRELLVSFVSDHTTVVMLPQSTSVFYGNRKHRQELMPATPAAYAFIFWMTDNGGLPADLSSGVVRLQNVCAAANWPDFAGIEDPDVLEQALIAYYSTTYPTFAEYLNEFTSPCQLST